MATRTRASRYDGVPLFADEPHAGPRPRDIGPAEGVVEHVVRDGDRLDALARQYYNDDRLWWRIADANPEFAFAGELVAPGRVGATILIPRARE